MPIGSTPVMATTPRQTGSAQMKGSKMPKASTATKPQIDALKELAKRGGRIHIQHAWQVAYRNTWNALRNHGYVIEIDYHYTLTAEGRSYTY